MPAPSHPTAFTHLATRTCYSLRDGVIRPRELAQATAEMGLAAVGIADRGGLYGAVRFAQACADVGVRPIYGATLALHPEPAHPGARTIRPGWVITRGPGIGALMGPAAPTGPTAPGSGQGWLADDAAQVALIAADDRGFATLNRTITDHHLESERSHPHLTWAQAVHRLGGTDPGVFVLLGADSPVGRLLAGGQVDAARAEARRWLDLVGPQHLLIGVTHHLAPGDDDRARRAFALADGLGLRAVAHQAARYLRPGDARVADVMDAVRQQVPLARHHSSRRNAEGYCKTPAQMARVFAERPDAIANTAWVADRCHVDIGLGRLRVPDFVNPAGHPAGHPASRTSDDRAAWATAELRRRCEQGLHDRFAEVDATQRDMLDRELDMVARLGLAPYFLTVAEIMLRIRGKGIMAACRGSAAGSLVTYALRISDVDPIAHDLAFERFMNPYRDELPDIDIDVESARREDIYRDLLDTYGEDRVACVAMVETFKARMAIREVGKAMGLPAAEIDYVAKAFPHVRAGDVRPAMAHLPELDGLNLEVGQMQLLFDVVERLDGFPRHIALHPCGILLADHTLRDIVPMERSATGFAMAQYDKDDVAALGLCKLDVLAVRMLSSMAHCTDQVRRTRGVEVDFDHVGWGDADTYDLIRSTRTLGMFQIESPGQRELVGRFQPEHLDDLVVDISLFRPGPVKGDMIKPFLRRRHASARRPRDQAQPRAAADEHSSDEAPWVPHPILDRALGETYGVIVYHEQVMRAVAAVTGCDLAEADLVRRRLGDPTQLAELEAWIKDGAAQRGVPADVAEWLWHALSQFASFGFCKAHAAAFSVPTYRSAWLKTHFLPEFMAGVLTHDPGMYPRRLILEDSRQFGVAILPLDVNASASDYTVEVVRADEAHRLLGVDSSADGPLPRGWRRTPDGIPIPPAGYDKGAADEPGWRYAIRLGLQDVERIDDHMVASLLLGRPFTSVADLRLRASLSQPVAESLAHAGAMDDIGGVSRGVRSRRDVLLEVNERWSGIRRHQPTSTQRRGGRLEQPQQLGLLEPEVTAGLPEYRPSERVRAELEVMGMDTTRHVITFYDTLLDAVGVTRASDLLDCREHQVVRIAGVKVATQTPPVKSGQRVIFLSLDDGTGVGDATFFESVHDACAWTVFHTWLLVVEGRVHRSGRRGVTLTANRAWDLRRLMVAWQGGWLEEALAEQGRPVDPAPASSAATATRDHDGAPSEGIRGAAGRSGLRMPDHTVRLRRDRPGEHLQMVEQHVPFGGMAPGGARVASQAIAAAEGRPDAGEVNGKPLADQRWRQHPAAEVGRPSRIGPNGTTWADPAGRHPGVDSQDTKRLSRNDPRHPDHAAVTSCTTPACPLHDAGAGPGRKLWHASPGSAGR